MRPHGKLSGKLFSMTILYCMFLSYLPLCVCSATLLDYMFSNGRNMISVSYMGEFLLLVSGQWLNEKVASKDADVDRFHRRRPKPLCLVLLHIR